MSARNTEIIRNFDGRFEIVRRRDPNDRDDRDKYYDRGDCRWWETRVFGTKFWFLWSAKRTYNKIILREFNDVMRSNYVDRVVYP